MSKEVEEAIEIVKNIRIGLMNFNELINDNKEIMDSIETVLNYIKKLEGRIGQKNLIMRKQYLIENDDEIKTKITSKLIDRCKETAPNNSCECCCCNEAECLGSLYLRLTTDIQKGV